MVTRTYGHTHTWSPTHTVHHGRRVHLYVFFFYEFIILIKEIDHPIGIYQTLTHDFKTLRHLSQSLHLYALHWSNGEHTSKCKGGFTCIKNCITVPAQHVCSGGCDVDITLIFSSCPRLMGNFATYSRRKSIQKSGNVLPPSLNCLALLICVS